MSCIDGGVLEALLLLIPLIISTEEEAEVDVDVEVKMEVEAGMDIDVYVYVDVDLYVHYNTYGLPACRRPMGRRFLHITSGLDGGGGNTAFEHLIRLVPKP